MLIPLRDTSRPYIFYAIVHLIPLKKHHRNTIVIMIPLQVEEFIVPLQSKPRAARGTPKGWREPRQVVKCVARNPC